MTPEFGDLTAFLLLAVAVGGGLYGRLSSEPNDVEELKRMYAAGELPEDEFERRLDVALDPETEKIRAVVEPINGIGTGTGRALAREFDSLADLRAASEDELKEVPGIGDKYANQIRERLNS